MGTGCVDSHAHYEGHTVRRPHQFNGFWVLGLGIRGASDLEGGGSCVQLNTTELRQTAVLLLLSYDPR